MSADRLETVLISNIVDGVGHTIVTDIAERSGDGDALIIGTDILQLAGFLRLNVVVGLEAICARAINKRNRKESIR